MNTSLRHTAWMLCGVLWTGSLPGCDQDGLEPKNDRKWLASSDLGAPPADMSGDPGPSCKAAEGLAADKRLLCVDFMGSGTPQIQGWTFQNMGCGTIGANQRTWTIANGALTLEGFDVFGSGTVDMNCSFSSPSLGATDLQGYKELTVSIVQRVDLRSGVNTEAAQRAQILLSGRVEPLAQFTGNNGTSFRRSMFTVPRAELPTSGMVQATFNLVTSGTAGSGPTGWQIQSIAVLGHK